VLATSAPAYTTGRLCFREYEADARERPPAVWRLGAPLVSFLGSDSDAIWRAHLQPSPVRDVAVVSIAKLVALSFVLPICGQRLRHGLAKSAPPPKRRGSRIAAEGSLMSAYGGYHT
jgi:hypothetical protein